jgi:rRNA maturation endonuclease Nob1
VDDHPLWQYFREVSTAVSAANQDGGAQPYARGSYMVSAYADDLELSVTDVSEEDAVLIAAELRAMGVRAVIRHSFVCPHCGLRVPKQDFCVNCRKRLPRRADET